MQLLTVSFYVYVFVIAHQFYVCSQYSNSSSGGGETLADPPRAGAGSRRPGARPVHHMVAAPPAVRVASTVLLYCIVIDLSGVRRVGSLAVEMRRCRWRV